MIWVFLAIVIIIVTWYWYFSRTQTQKIRRIFKSHSTKRIQHCKNDKINKIQGNLKIVSAAITAPLSDRKCAVYKIIVEEEDRYDKGHWEEIINDERKTNFLIQDGNHYAFILTSSASLLLHIDENFESGRFNDASDKLNWYLESFGKKSTGFFGFNKSMKYKEGILEENEKVSVYGIGKWHDITEYKELAFLEKDGVSKVFIFRNTSEEPLYISDDLEVLKYD